MVQRCGTALTFVRSLDNECDVRARQLLRPTPVELLDWGGALSERQLRGGGVLVHSAISGLLGLRHRDRTLSRRASPTMTHHIDLDQPFIVLYPDTDVWPASFGDVKFDDSGNLLIEHLLILDIVSRGAFYDRMHGRPVVEVLSNSPETRSVVLRDADDITRWKDSAS